jgi:hypothetical protein
MKNITPILVSHELRMLINYIRARSILEGHKEPTYLQITKKIAEKINKEELWHEFAKQ